MSLINKMLQDLDARGSQPGSTMPVDVRAAATVRRRLPVMQIASVTGVVVVGVAIAVVFWLKRPGQTAAPVVRIAAPVIAPVVTPVAAPIVPAAVAPVTAPVAAAMAPPVPVAQASAPASAPAVTAAPVPPPVSETPAPVGPKVAKSSAVVQEAPKVRVVELDRIKTAAPPPVRSIEPPAPKVGGREMTAGQRSESQYRNALAALEEGRVAAALDGLEQTLKLNPRHDAARQSLVALLIESGRNDEAMQQLEQGLAVDPAQPTLAMLLARMQIERGNSGVATLMRTLPAATGNADYHAFLAGALQRESRHREAAEQYGAALRQSPEHGVWLMGLGISLQAEKRDREALTAFQRAKASGSLTPPLLAFVERKVQQLAP